MATRSRGSAGNRTCRVRTALSRSMFRARKVSRDSLAASFGRTRAWTHCRWLIAITSRIRRSMSRTRMLAHSDASMRVRDIDRLIRDVIAISQRQCVHARVRPKLAASESRDTFRARNIERDKAVLTRHVRLPADPRDRVAMTHQEAVAEIGGRAGIGDARRAVEHAERDLAAAVGHVEQQPPLALARINGLQQIKVGRELDASLGVLLREPDVSDLPMQRMSGIGGEADHPRDLFIGAGIAEGFSAENHFAFLDIETRHHVVPLAISRL